jgi:hypothetical protein
MSKKVNIITQLENKINNLNDINEWSDRLNAIIEIKKDINEETQNINNILESLDEPITITKEYNINKIINDFDKVDLSKKIKYYQFLNKHIKSIENDLFD